MRKCEFIKTMVGKPWVNRAYSFDECDCFGLVYLYMSEVLKVIPKLTDEYLTGDDFEVAFSKQLETGQWQKQERQEFDSIVFMMYSGDIPMHCGIMISKTECLHAFGNKGRGQVQLWKLAQVKTFLRRYYNQDPKVEFYKWVG